MTEALSFLHAMLVVCASFEERLLNRWVEGESSRADQLFGMDANHFEIIARTYLSDIVVNQLPERLKSSIMFPWWISWNYVRK